MFHTPNFFTQMYIGFTILLPSTTGLANCRYVAHQSDRQGLNAPKGYFARQEMTPEIAHIQTGYRMELHGCKVIQVITGCTQFFFWCPF